MGMTRYLTEVKRSLSLHLPLRVMNLDGEFSLSKVQIFQLFPKKDPARLGAIGDVVLSNSTVREPQQPGQVAPVPHLVEVDAVTAQAFNYVHVPDGD